MLQAALFKTVCARELRPGHLIKNGRGGYATVAGTEFCNGKNGEPMQLIGSISTSDPTALALKISFEKDAPVYMHPGRKVMVHRFRMLSGLI